MYIPIYYKEINNESELLKHTHKQKAVYVKMNYK